MDRNLLERYKQNKRELRLNEARLSQLYGRLECVPVVSGKVSKSSDDFPYIEEHVTVEMESPKEASALRIQILQKERRNETLRREMTTVEDWIAAIPDGVGREIFEMAYLEGMTQKDIAGQIGYTQARISQIIRDLSDKSDGEKDL